MHRFVLMGVSGSGKTTVGEALARGIGLRFIDGESLHPQANIDKMAAARPLDDDDRAPWLAQVGRTLAQDEGPIAIGCSALKRDYRDQIRAAVEAPVGFLHLYAPKPVLAKRVAARQGHFMPPALLDSQYADLEHLEPDETGRLIETDQPVPAVVADCAAYVTGVMP